jgi:hypothetical protein
LNLNPTGGFESHKVVHSVGARARDRDLAHRQAAKQSRLESRQAAADPGFVSRFTARWRQRAKIAIEPAVQSAQRTVTDVICHLQDGSPGRIVVQEIDGQLVEDCVPI